MANTVILKWNPAVSSYNMVRFLTDIVQETDDSDWSIRDHEHVRRGDVFYMVKVGSGQTGIVMQGKITSDPEAGEDWSGRGRKTYYCNYRAEIMISPDTFKILSTAELQDNIPGFEWTGGPAGVILEPESAAVLEKMWNSYLQENAEEFLSRLELIRTRRFYNDQLFLGSKMSKKLFG